MIRPLGSMFVDVGNDPRRPARVMAEQVVSRVSVRSNAIRNGAAVSIDDTASSGRPNQGDGMTHGRLPSPAFSEHLTETPATACEVAPSQPVPGARRGTGASVGAGPASSQDGSGPRSGCSLVVPAVPVLRPSRVWRFFFTGDLRRLR